MDTFVDSSWYFYRFADAHNDKLPFDPAKVGYWSPGRFLQRRRRARDPAPDLLALLRARLPRPRHGRPHRAVHAPADAGHGAQGRRRDVQVEGQRRRSRHDDREGRRGRAAPVRDVRGAAREGSRVDRQRPRRQLPLARSASGRSRSSGARPRPPPAPIDVAALTADDRAMRRKTHDTIRRVTLDIDVRKQFNTAISAMMELVNDLYAFTKRQESGAVAAGRRRSRRKPSNR